MGKFLNVFFFILIIIKFVYDENEEKVKREKIVYSDSKLEENKKQVIINTILIFIKL